MKLSNTNNIEIKLIDFGFHAIKNLLIIAITPIMNGPAFPLAANIALSSILSETKGEI
jgi:hypothetical protein